ncbi:RNA-directed DNA polymerase from mobile element jockey-like, partial [Brachionus plicatilis]
MDRPNPVYSKISLSSRSRLSNNYYPSSLINQSIPYLTSTTALPHNVNSELKCIYTNATSLRCNIKRADLELRAKEVDVIFVTETWFKDTSTVSFDFFKHFRRDRGSQGGGVIIYVKDSLLSSEISDNILRRTLVPLTGNVEQVWCEISRHQDEKKVLIEDKVKYTDNAAAINRSIGVAARAVENGLYSGLCVTGDFNFPDIKWTGDFVMNQGKDNGLSGKFLDTLENFSLHQAVRNPTFFPANSNPVNILDLVIGDGPERIDIHMIGAPLGKARQAHAVVEFVLHLNSSKTSKYGSTRFNYTKGKYSELRMALSLINWEAELDTHNINEAYDRFIQIYNCLCSKHIPKSRNTVRNFKLPWMTSELVKLNNKRKRLFVHN